MVIDDNFLAMLFLGGSFFVIGYILAAINGK
jgi:hypothetical protein